MSRKDIPTRATKDISRRTTVYFSPDLHKALSLKCLETGSTMSQLINSLVAGALAQDAQDLDAYLLHANEDTVSFESFICELRRRGRI